MKNDALNAIAAYMVNQESETGKIIENTKQEREKLAAELMEEKDSFIKKPTGKAVSDIAEKENRIKAYDGILLEMQKKIKGYRESKEMKSLQNDVITECRENEEKNRAKANELIKRIEESTEAIRECINELATLNDEKNNYCQDALKIARKLTDPVKDKNWNGNTIETEIRHPIFNGVDVEKIFSVSYASQLNEYKPHERIRVACSRL